MPAQSFEAGVLVASQQAADIFLLTVYLPPQYEKPKAGQFYMLRAWAADEPPLLSRPISVHHYEEGTRALSFLFQVKGPGTRRLAALRQGDTLQLTGPAGNGFALEGEKVALVGGGIGTAPLFYLAEQLTAQGAQVECLLGFRDEPYRLAHFAGGGRRVRIATDTGSYGHHGFVTELLQPQNYDVVYICGPEPMMRATVQKCLAAGTKCYVSMERKMACGLGACLGCTCKTEKGALVCICKEGPVFEGGVFFG
ncbi:MAG: dihydroorotate dehydrogenase electron transfer subunit [Ruthenibacterium sp.]